MKKEKQGRAQSSAATNKAQTITKTENGSKRGRVQVRFPKGALAEIQRSAEFRGESRSEFILDAVRAKVVACKEDEEDAALSESGGKPAESASGASVATAKPEVLQTREQLEGQRRDRENGLIEPSLYLWARDRMTDVQALLYMAEAIDENERALVDYANGCKPWNRVEYLPILSMAKGMTAANADGREIAQRATQTGEMDFPSLPGLLGRRRVKVRAVLESMSWFLIGAREVIERKIIPGMQDRRKAVKLVEALVMAQDALQRAGSELRDTGSSTKLAESVLVEAMQAGDTKEGGAR
jgi:hypothetical protein